MSKRLRVLRAAKTVAKQPTQKAMAQTVLLLTSTLLHRMRTTKGFRPSLTCSKVLLRHWEQHYDKILATDRAIGPGEL